ncbi:CD209 antigen-like protein C [Conger conger]|uniref:CD209 antigen-like protein C n=1 Tax=Conger conger TaxID=82655 RepID=UPI002A5AC76B|nr:CD209 antigen-like protein C [Conger conger]
MAASTVSKDSEGIYTELASTQQDVYSTLGHTTLNSSRAQHTEKRGQSSHPYWLAAVCLLSALLLAATIALGVLYQKRTKCESTECSNTVRELVGLKANYSRGFEERRKINTAFLSILEKNYQFLDEYCTLNSKEERVCKPCRQGWEQFSSKCYYFSTERKSWKDSRRDCFRRGADLVIIESDEEQGFITNRTREHPYWIGLTDLETEGTWLWVDKTSLQKGFWRSGEPDDLYWSGDETQSKEKDADCAVTVPNENTWKDSSCFSRFKFVCETGALLF